MSCDRRRQVLRFRPSLDGANPGSAMELESRVVLSTASYPLTAVTPGQPLPAVHVSHRISKSDRIPEGPRSYVQTFVATGGKTAVMIDTDGEVYAAHISGTGVVRAKSAPGGRVDLFVYGSSGDTTLSIDPAGPTIAQGGAHKFPTGFVLHNNVINIRNITVVNGMMNNILGYRTAQLSGAVTLSSQYSSVPFVDRIAFESLLPGASINVPTTLQTLDVYNNVSLDGGPGIVVGQDLNAMTVGGGMTMVNGASLRVGRDLGAVLQPAKGSGSAGAGLNVTGDLVVSNGATIAVGRYFGSVYQQRYIIIQGSSFGLATLPANVQANTVVYGNRG